MVWARFKQLWGQHFTEVIGEDESCKSPEVVLDLTAQGDKVIRK